MDAEGIRGVNFPGTESQVINFYLCCTNWDRNIPSAKLWVVCERSAFVLFEICLNYIYDKIKDVIIVYPSSTFRILNVFHIRLIYDHFVVSIYVCSWKYSVRNKIHTTVFNCFFSYFVFILFIDFFIQLGWQTSVWLSWW